MEKLDALDGRNEIFKMERHKAEEMGGQQCVRNDHGIIANSKQDLRSEWNDHSYCLSG